MKKLLLTVTATALALSFGASAYAQDIKPRLIRFGYGLNEDSNQGRAARFFAEEVAKRSDGKLKTGASLAGHASHWLVDRMRGRNPALDFQERFPLGVGFGSRMR